MDEAYFSFPPTFAGSEHAQYLWQMLNQDYYQFQLAELQKLLAREGYTLSFRKDHRVILPSDVQSAIAKELIAKRERYLAPQRILLYAMKLPKPLCVMAALKSCWKR